MARPRPLLTEAQWRKIAPLLPKPPEQRKGTKWMVVVDGAGVPLGDQLHSASPAEVRLAETTLAAIRVGRRQRAGRPRQKPVRVIADKAYDSDPLRRRLQRRGIERICPHKKNRVRRHRMVARCGGIGDAGLSNAPSAGWETSGAWSCATTARSKSTGRSFILPAS